MTSLGKFQNDFANHLLGEDKLPLGLSGSQASLSRRLSVYRNNVFYSLTNALGDLYPVVRQLVGEEFFRHLARHYLIKSPPARASMVHLGSDFPNFLEQDELETGLDYLADVARLELARHESFHARNCKAPEPETFQQLGVEKLMSCRFSLHPSLRLLKSRWAVHSIWAAHQDEQKDLGFVQLEEPEAALVIRPETNPLIYAVEPALIDFLNQLSEDKNLSCAIEQTLENNPGFDAGTALAFCISQGIFIEIRPDK